MEQKNKLVKHEITSKETQIINILLSNAKTPLRDIAKKNQNKLHHSKKQNQTPRRKPNHKKNTTQKSTTKN